MKVIIIKLSLRRKNPFTWLKKLLSKVCFFVRRQTSTQSIDFPLLCRIINYFLIYPGFGVKKQKMLLLLCFVVTTKNLSPSIIHESSKWPEMSVIYLAFHCVAHSESAFVNKVIEMWFTVDNHVKQTYFLNYRVAFGPWSKNESDWNFFLTRNKHFQCVNYLR